MPNIIEIQSVSDRALDVFARLTESQLRSRLEPEKGIFIAESPKVIEIALRNGYEPVSFLMERKHIEGQAAALLARCETVPVYTADREVLEHLTGYTLTRGILCALRRPQQPTLEEVCAGKRRIAVLDGVVDATNIGAIIRSAAALNMDAVVLSPTCCDPLNRRAVRVSMGTVFQIPWMQISSADEAAQSWVASLHALGFKIAAMALKADSVNIDDPQLNAEAKLAVVMGAEGNGLSDAAIDACDYTVCIPMGHGVDSLNVAAASAVAFWQLQK